MYLFPRAVTKYHTWDDLKHRNTFSPNPAGWKSRVSIAGLKPRNGQDTPPHTTWKSWVRIRFWLLQFLGVPGIPRSGVAPPRSLHHEHVTFLPVGVRPPSCKHAVLGLPWGSSG